MIISFTNNKGGTGKTTTTVNLAAALALMGRRVLLVDLDPQGNSTVGVGLEKAKLLYTVYDVLTQNKKVPEVTLSTKVENLSILPSNLDLAGAEVELSSVPGREFVLREAMSQIKHKYDAILIDCPPNVGILTLNAIVASDLLVIPVQCEFYPMEGLPTLLKVMNMVRSRLKTNFEYRVLLTMYDSRTGLSKSVVRQVKEKFGERVLSVIVRRSVRMAEAPAKGVPGIIFSPKNQASEEYRELAMELLAPPILMET
jgi:chromosome partitioning protein